MLRRINLFLILTLLGSLSCFGQTTALRDYVGKISQNFHPNVISYMRKFQENYKKRGNDSAVKSIDRFLQGDSGTGFVYVADNGSNYIITNYHVISQAVSLSVVFEKVDGEKTSYSDLSIIAADEDMDIALLAFPAGQKPFKQGLAFLDRPLQEGDDVYSAGFPGLGDTMIWQLGRGMVSNASVKLPDQDDRERTIGPFIQHTAQVDPGNSGGPLLVQTKGVPTGFAVAGINTLSARYRQAANFSIPMYQVRSFLDASLKSKKGAGLDELKERVDTFIKEVNEAKPPYHRIAAYLSKACTAENAEYAISEINSRAPRRVQDDIMLMFSHSPVEGMSYAVAWIIENAIGNRAKKISITVDSIEAIDDNNYTVNLIVNDKPIKSEWINEYGIWRIRNFGGFASGDASLIKDIGPVSRLRAEPNLQVSASPAYVFDRGFGFGADLYFRAGWFGFGSNTLIAENYFQLEGSSGVFAPLKAKNIAFTPFGLVGLGFQISGMNSSGNGIVDGGFSFQAGFQITTSTVPGLFFVASYKRNVYFLYSLANGGKGKSPPDLNVIFIGIGYGL